MKLIVGLGNPGKTYADSRHNAGFQVIKALAEDCGALLKKDNAAFSLSGKCRIEGRDVILALPLTFMNLSGLAVKALLKKHKAGLEKLLVVCDDLDLEFGRIKIRASGGSAGQRGLKSVIDSLKSRDFCRLRVGIGRPPHQLVSKNVGKVNWCGGRPLHDNIDVAGFVLSPFTRKEKEELRGIAEEAVDCCKYWVIHGAAASMNRFNKRSKNA